MKFISAFDWGKLDYSKVKAYTDESDKLWKNVNPQPFLKKLFNDSNYVVKNTHIRYNKNNQYGYDFDLRKNDLRVILTNEQKENLQELVTWDFDINDAQNVNLFMGDNNDGMSVISIEQKSERDYDIKIGFVKSNSRKYVSPDTYMKQTKDYYDKDFSKSFNQICKMFDVEILGSKAVK